MFFSHDAKTSSLAYIIQTMPSSQDTWRGLQAGVRNDNNIFVVQYSICMSSTSWMKRPDSKELIVVH